MWGDTERQSEEDKLWGRDVYTHTHTERERERGKRIGQEKKRERRKTCPRVIIMMDTFASHGMVLSPEQQACLNASLTLKAREAGLAELSFFGKLTTTSGKDYFIAQGTKSFAIVSGVASLTTKCFVSQDAMTWLELEAVDATTAALCATITTPLTGDLQHTIAVADPQESADEDAGAPEADEEEAEETKTVDVVELSRVAYVVGSLETDCVLFPKDFLTVNAKGSIVPNPSFSGIQFPNKLESFVKTNGLSSVGTSGVGQGPTAKDDLPGSWAIRYDAMTNTTVLRSLLWPGFVFVYDGKALTTTSLYFGGGMKNVELPFLL